MKILLAALLMWPLILPGCGDSVAPKTRMVQALVPNAEQIVTLSPGDVFTWDANTRLSARNECTLVIPTSLLSAGEPFSTIIDGDDDMGLHVPDDEHSIYLGLRPAMSVTILRQCDATVLGPSNDLIQFVVELNIGNGE